MENDADNLMDQMDQPATPSRTAAAMASPCGPDGPDNVSSPDPPSTRPNPFDDSDLSARKRRRTSGSVSASPPPSTSTDVLLVSAPGPASASTSAFTSSSASLSAAVAAEDGPSLKHFATDATSALDEQSNAAEKLEIPDTPKTPTDSTKSSPAPLSSSRVTINLRKAVGPDLTTARSISPSLNGEKSPPIISDTTSRGQQEITTGDQPQPQSSDHPTQMSDSASPPVELIAISDNENGQSDDEMAFSVDDKATGALRSELLPLDPTPQFPYIHQNEEPSQPLLRFINHFVADSPVNPEAIVHLQAWIEDYLSFTRTAGESTVLDSRQANNKLWTLLPEALNQLSTRCSELVKSPEMRNAILGLYSTFACLTARMAALDLAVLQETQSVTVEANQALPDLYSAYYMQQLQKLIVPDVPSTDASEEGPTGSEWTQDEVGIHLLLKLQTGLGGSVETLSQLTASLARFVPQFPRLMDHMAVIARLLGGCLRESVRAIATGDDEAIQAQTQLDLGCATWNHISTCLEMVIDKHVTQLSVETATVLIQALTDVLKWTLRGDHGSAFDAVQQHIQEYPELPYVYAFESIAWQWRLGILDRLIRSGQMQLRVMAISRLCADLVSVWRSATDTGDEGCNKFLEYIGDCLLETRLIDYIFGPNCHPEIIVESSNVLGFLVITKMYKQEHTDRLWQGLTLCQDPRVADALARMVGSITNLFNYNGLLGWCQKFQTLPLEGFSLPMRSLWENVMSDMISRCQSERQTPSFEPFDLCLRLLREASVCTAGSQVADPDLQLAAMQKLRELVDNASSDDVDVLYLSCLDDISQKSPTALGSLWFLSMTIRGNVANEIQNLTENHDLARLVVEELAHAVSAGQQAGAFAVLSGTSNAPRRDLIASIIQFQPAALKDELGSRLLDIMVGPESPCPDDRKAGWFIITNVMRKATMKNTFLQACFSDYLPSLPASCFSDGMLEFVRERVLSLAEDGSDFALDDPESLSHSGVEQLWRIILEAGDSILVSRAISTLAVDLYLESKCINLYSVCRSREVHISLVNRCLGQMKQAAKKLNGSSESIVSDDDEPMVIVSTTEEINQQERGFRRSLQLMRFFLEKYQAHSKFGAADFRPFMSSAASAIQGESAGLQYQTFDNHQESDIKPLGIGRENTVASLLTRLSNETGFEDYRIYYRGQQLLPKEDQASKSLEELGIYDGFILVKREQNSAPLAGYIKPGSSPLEIEILRHFQDLWEYLGMDEKLAEEIYDFLVKLPADSHFVLKFDSEQTSHTQVFLKGQAFKTLYGIHALSDYTEAVEHSASTASSDNNSLVTATTSYQQAISRGLCLIVRAIGDFEILGEVSIPLQLRIAGSFMQVFVKLFTEAVRYKMPLDLNGGMLPNPTRIVEILAKAEEDMSDTSLTLIESACTAVLRVGIVNREFWSLTVASTSFLEAVKTFLLKDPRKAVRQTIAELIEDVTGSQRQLLTPESGHSASASASEQSDPILSSICKALIDGLHLCLMYPSQPEEYFRALLYVASRACTITPQVLDIEHVAEVTRDLLLKHTSVEIIDQPDVTDPVADGLVSVLHMCLQNSQSLARSPKFDESIVSRLFWRHLFPRKRRGEADNVPRVILNLHTRRKLYDVLFLFVRSDLNSFVHILDTLNGLVPFYMDEPDDPYLYELPYQFDRFRAIRAPCGYVGLRNLSNTCYLNSLLTQLFMNTQFRSFIMSVALRDPKTSQQLLFYTQKLFGYMQESYQRFVDPFDVVTSIKTYDDTPIDIQNQMDVDEFYNLLFDRWEGQLRDRDDKKRLRSFFGGQLVQQVKSKECEHISERLEPFSAIQCDIKGKATLQESLQAYVDGEVMEGENKYKCSTCDRHVDAVKRACLKDVPDNLIFHLKRFDFNLRTLQRRKINDYFAFPSSLDIAPYTVEHLSATDGVTRSDIFELVGVLVHSGTAESGHYYSYIRERDTTGRPSWVEFNDDSVSPWDPTLMDGATFGGPDPQFLHETNGILYDRTYSAYMLFYQRASSLHGNSPSAASTKSAQPSCVEIPPPLKEHILNENKMLLRRHCLFDTNHSRFVQQCFSHSIYLGESQVAKSHALTDVNDDDDFPTPTTSTHTLQNLAMELALSHFDQVITRTKDMVLTESFSSMLQSSVAKCYDCAFAFCNYFIARPAAFRAVIQRNPDPDVRSFAGRTLVLAASKIRSGLPRLYHCPSPSKTMSNTGSGESDDDWDDSETPPSVLQGLIGIFDYLWKFFYMHIRSWDEYFGTVLAFAKLGEPEVGCLLTENYLLKLLHIINADPTMDLQPNYQRMVNNLVRRFNSKPASYAAILALVEYLMSHLEPTLSAEVIVDEATDRRDLRQPFPWTSEEVQAIHNHPDSPATSFFMEKLLELDQVPEVTNMIVSRVVATGEELDLRVFNTLRKKIQGETTTQALDSSIRAASRYIESSESSERVQALIRHVCIQARSLQHNEGLIFLDLVDSVLRLRLPDEDLAQERRMHSIQAIPTWAPYLLVYSDERTRSVAERLINNGLFLPSAYPSLDGQDAGEPRERETLGTVIRQLGISCLVYLREVHVKRRIQLERNTAGNILRVISNCVSFYEAADEMNDAADDSVEFRAIQEEISSPLQRLLVDEIDDDGSEWDGSCGSSELMDANVGALVQTTNHVHD